MHDKLWTCTQLPLHKLWHPLVWYRVAIAASLSASALAKVVQLHQKPARTETAHEFAVPIVHCCATASAVAYSS